MSIDRYDPIRVLGEGSFGKVYLMRDKSKRNLVCVKIIKIKNIPKKEREATKVEVDLLRRLHHPNIVRYVDSFLSRNNESLCICMEYCDGGDLASQIKAARRNLFSESKILHWFVQLALGLHYMHANKVLHRDLKTQNIFMLGNGRLVLGDLGISKVLDGTMDFAQTCIGTPYYMSPEIFKNKPYSYKSDVWALGCVLYEMTTLTHAFDANSLNGLATKIIKGKYPPIHAKYSKYLRELIQQMLMINPQQRPDLDQILRKPFIKKHVVNFFVDIAARPAQSIGEGTMIFKAAAGGQVNGSVMNDTNMISLRQQLNSLDMTEAVSEALRPKATPQDDEEALRQAREQASALKREQEHKRMVEAALEKLRQERELRLRQKNQEVGGAAGRGGGAAIRQVQQASNIPASRNNVNVNDPRNVKPVVSQQPANSRPSNITPSGAGAGGGYNGNINAQANAANAGAGVGAVRNGGMNWNNRRPTEEAAVKQQDDITARRRSYGEDRERIIERERKTTEERKRQQEQQELLARAKAREEARQRDEQRQREDAAERLRLERAEQLAKQKRDIIREKERERQRIEIEQLKRDKIELDKRVEREKQREERIAREKNKRDQLDVMQEKLNYMNDQVGKLDIGSNIINGNSNNRYRSEEKNDEVSAREKIYQRKQEKQAKEEAERLEALREAEMENRRIRNVAQNEYRNKIYGDSNSVLPNAVGTGAGTGANSRRRSDYNDDQRETYYEFDTGKRNSKNRMDEDELASRLEEINRGSGGGGNINVNAGNSGSRFEQNSNSGGSSSRSNNPQQQQQQQQQREISSKANAANMPNISISTYNSDSGSDDDLWGQKIQQGQGDGGEEDEVEDDILRRENELQVELQFATQRVEDLRRTLQETKSFLGPRLPTRGKEVLQSRDHNSNNIPQVHQQQRPNAAAAAQGRPLEEAYYEEEEFEEDDDFDEFGESGAYDESWNEDGPSNSNKNSKGGNYDHRNDISESTIRRVKLESAVPSYGGLQDLPSPSGRLSDRIERLRQRCIEALGRDAFIDAYSFLKQHEEESQGIDNGRDLNDDEYDRKKISRIRAILGDGKAQYMSLIEQLIFMEETHLG